VLAEVEGWAAQFERLLDGHASLAMVALAFLAAVRAQAGRAGAGGG